ncbi:hypothetical protein ACMA5I_07890 [Paracoccaceae bacterium GXU_MW_L88]
MKIDTPMKKFRLAGALWCGGSAAVFFALVWLSMTTMDGSPSTDGMTLAISGTLSSALIGWFSATEFGKSGWKGWGRAALFVFLVIVLAAPVATLFILIFLAALDVIQEVPSMDAETFTTEAIRIISMIPAAIVAIAALTIALIAFLAGPMILFISPISALSVIPTFILMQRDMIRRRARMDAALTAAAPGQ